MDEHRALRVPVTGEERVDAAVRDVSDRLEADPEAHVAVFEHALTELRAALAGPGPDRPALDGPALDGPALDEPQQPATDATTPAPGQ